MNEHDNPLPLVPVHRQPPHWPGPHPEGDIHAPMENERLLGDELPRDFRMPMTEAEVHCD